MNTGLLSKVPLSLVRPKTALQALIDCRNVETDRWLRSERVYNEIAYKSLLLMHSNRVKLLALPKRALDLEGGANWVRLKINVNKSELPSLTGHFTSTICITEGIDQFVYFWSLVSSDGAPNWRLLEACARDSPLLPGIKSENVVISASRSAWDSSVLMLFLSCYYIWEWPMETDYQCYSEALRFHQFMCAWCHLGILV